ncbi:TBC1 domain family member 10A [Colossoma macropomum]|uniref:TBC1 domain family member 10A n=1 Tax=Colossoma macropomum TaxID=42526 RepID=UPI0018644C30|nr:TBC1 domain family member 10A [Colossoma macropomum]
MARLEKLENGRQPADTVSLQTVGSQLDDESSLGSDSELNGFPSSRETDKYGFIGGAQKYSADSAQDVPPEVLRQREVKWLDMLNNWDKWISKKFKKVRLRCQKGIPPSLRGRAWLYLSGGKVKKERNSEMFKELDSMEGDPKWIDVIERDLHRQFPFHEMFVSRGGHGQQDLLRVLKAYTLYRPDEGYCQAQAPIAAVLLMHMPAEDAFWGLVQICEKYLPGYYSAGLEAIQLDGEILNALLKRVCPIAYKHLDKHKIEPILYMTEWFMCAFSRTLPWASVLRVWDMFLCDGVKIIFRVGLVLLKCMLGTREKLKACPGQYETMELLRALEPKYMQEAFLVQQVLELPISARHVEREHRVQLKRWRKTHGELRYNAAPRMHGARIIMDAEPHTRQDLRQKPTIIVSYPSAPELNPDFNRGKKRGTLRKNPAPVPNIPNPYALPSDHTPAQQAAPANQPGQPSAVAEPPNQAPPNPAASKKTSQPLQQPSLTNQQEPVKEALPPIEGLKLSPNNSVIQNSSAPNTSFIEPTNPSAQPLYFPPPPSPCLNELPPPLSPSLNELPPPPPPPLTPPPPPPTPAPPVVPLQNWRPHLQDYPPLHTSGSVKTPVPIPEDSQVHEIVENSSPVLAPPPTTDLAPLLTPKAPASEDFTATHDNHTLCRSSESVNSSEDTYL